MRERGAFGFFAILLIVTILFFSLASDDTGPVTDGAHGNAMPTVMINGRSFTPDSADAGKTGRMVIVIDQDDLFVGENTVEIVWGETPAPVITAELPTVSREE